MAVPAPPASTPSIGDALGEEIARLQEFIGLLQREQQLLGGRDTEALLALSENKNALANSLAELSRARDQRLKALGLAAGREGMQVWLSRRNAKDGERQAWARLLELATTARDLNALNGNLIGMHMQHNQQVLAALLSAADNAATYGPDGQQQAGLGGRILGKA